LPPASSNRVLSVTMYGLDVFNRITVAREHAERYPSSQHPGQQLAGQLLIRRRDPANGSAQDYLAQIGAAGWGMRTGPR
jgi:hypothetical protein